MIIKPKTRGFICVTAHPEGCAENVSGQIEYVKAQGGVEPCGATLVIGASAGYGLSSIITSAFGAKDETIGVFLDRPPQGTRTAAAGWYNMAAFERETQRAGIYSRLIAGDAFSHETKAAVIRLLKERGVKLGRVIYSVAAPMRIDPDTGEKYYSCIKPVGAEYFGKSIDLNSYTLCQAHIEPATDMEIEHTVKVMGGEDWKLWMDSLYENKLLSDDCVTISYSYIGPQMTHPIYLDGTIGQAKRHLKKTADELNAYCKAYVSVNKAVVTQASSAIPVVPLYISILFNVMKRLGLHEDCIQQIVRMYKKLEKQSFTDENGLIRMDDYEMRPDVQDSAAAAWRDVTNDNLCALADTEGYKAAFLSLFGFGIPGVDYDKDTSVMLDFNPEAT